MPAQGGAGRGRWTGLEANAAIERIARTVEIALRNRLAGLDVREIIGWAASAMAISVDDWHRVRTAAHQSLATAKAVQTYTENATAVQVVLRAVRTTSPS